VLNLQFALASGEILTPDTVQRLIERADHDKIRKAQERFRVRAPPETAVSQIWGRPHDAGTWPRPTHASLIAALVLAMATSMATASTSTAFVGRRFNASNLPLYVRTQLMDRWVSRCPEVSVTPTRDG